MKSNPLFIDSTKFKGELILAEIEVFGVNLHLTEKIFSKITLSDNRTYIKEMVFKNNKYICSLKLSYKEEAWIKHFIVRGEVQVEENVESRFNVNYINQFSWDRQVKAISIRDSGTLAISNQ